MIGLVTTICIVLIGATGALAAQATCSLTQKCPEDTPCCSQYGECGVGAYCLGGCDPRMSFSLDSCVPAPQCESKIFPMKNLNGIAKVSEYLGDPKTADWVSQGTPLPYNDENVLLTMPANSVGTVLASTAYMWYGTVTATLKTSRGAGVVTAFILLSDVKDEIDYEFVGTELQTAQTNYYFQGIPDYDNSANISISDTFANFHTYQIQWTPDSITWLVDGQVGRVKKRSDSWNATANQWNYPQTPARVQLSIWPGGASSNAPGTISWAGGPIDWNSPDISTYGYDFAMLGQVEIQCYNASSAPGTNNAVSYTYNSWLATNDTVENGDKPTVLKSFQGSGIDMDAGGNSSDAGSSATGSNSIPGGSSNGPGNNQGGDGSGSTTTESSPPCSETKFSQSCGSGSSKNDGGRLATGERMLGASAFAVVIALAGLIVL